MCYPPCHKEDWRGGCQVERILVNGIAIMDKVTGMVKSHNYHNNSSQQVNRLTSMFIVDCHVLSNCLRSQKMRERKLVKKRVGLADVAAFENRQPVTAAKLITKNSLFIHLLMFFIGWN